VAEQQQLLKSRVYHTPKSAKHIMHWQ